MISLKLSHYDHPWPWGPHVWKWSDDTIIWNNVLNNAVCKRLENSNSEVVQYFKEENTRNKLFKGNQSFLYNNINTITLTSSTLFVSTYRAIDESFALCSFLLDCYSRNLATCFHCLRSSFLFHCPTIPAPPPPHPRPRPRPRPGPSISFRMPLARNLSLAKGYIITQWLTRYVHD